MKKPKLLLAALVLLIGAASAAGARLHATLPAGSHQGDNVMLKLQHKAGS